MIVRQLLALGGASFDVVKDKEGEYRPAVDNELLSGA